MKLQQGQLWKKDDDYLRIIHWERLAIEYKLMHGSPDRKGSMHRVTKKEFCRLLKGAELVTLPKEEEMTEPEELETL